MCNPMAVGLDPGQWSTSDRTEVALFKGKSSNCGIEQELAGFFCIGPGSKNFGFVSHVVSVLTT